MMRSENLGKQKKSVKIKDVAPHSSSDQYQILFENAGDALMVVDLTDGHISEANLKLQELTGYHKSEFESQTVDILAPPTGVKGRAIFFSGALLDGSGFFEDVVLRAKDGLDRFVSLSVKHLRLNQRPVAMCIIRDVGEKKAMERELITKHTELRNAYVSLEKANAEHKMMQETLVQSGKLAALGELAAGIAHELNQPLTVIRGFTQESIEILEADKTPHAVSQCIEHLGEVVRATQKMEKIISHLRNFTRKSTEDFQWIDLHAVINEALMMLDRQFQSRGIAVERKYAPGLPQVYCNPFQLEQVFINLATNARDAIESKKTGGGHITVTTETIENGLVQVKFADDGCGISESIKSKIFNPFFTTKEVGKGMGLGLSITYGILSKLNASVFLESSLGRGSVFTIKLPVDYRKL